MFSFSGIARDSFLYFFTPDLLCIALLSIIVACKPSEKLQFVILGAFLYATLFCFHASLAGEEGWLSSIFMLFGLLFNFLLCFGKSLFRESKTNNINLNLFKSFVQTAFIWTLFLIIIPYIILKASEAELSCEIGDWNVIIGSIFLILCSMLGIWSGYLFSVLGNGTPLPLDATKKLVISGPYSYVRNPMAIAGLGQGFSISLIVFSLPVFLYVLLGMIIWNYSVRRIEELDLLDKFGQEYLSYKNQVNCWWPRLTPYVSKKLNGEKRDM